MADQPQPPAYNQITRVRADGNPWVTTDVISDQVYDGDLVIQMDVVGDHQDLIMVAVSPEQVASLAHECVLHLDAKQLQTLIMDAEAQRQLRENHPDK